jgi:hypothetical protein
MTPAIRYVPDSYCFSGNNFPTCSPNEFLDRLKNKLPTYEVMPTNDENIKMYFDFDYKWIEKENYNLDVAVEINRIFKDRISKALISLTNIQPNFHIMESHTDNYDDKNGKYSLRYFISNYICSRSVMKDFTIDVNKYFDTAETELWDYLEKHGDTFDLSVYTKERKIRCFETSKPNEKRPLRLVEGNIEGTIITSFFDKDAVEFKYESKQSTSTSSTLVLSGNANFKKISELGEIISMKYIGVSGCYIDWCKILWSLRTESVEYKEIARDISKRGGSLYDEDVFEKTWDAFTQKAMTINTFYYYCKSSDESKFKEVCAKYSDKKITDDTSYYTTIENIKDLYQCSILISSKLKDVVILCNEQWFVLQSTNLWNRVKDPTFQITTQIRKYIDYNHASLAEKLKNCDDEKERANTLKEIKTWFDCYTLVNGSGYMTPLMKNLRPQLTDNDFETKLDVLKYQVAYKNGILDLKSGFFREGIIGSDFITKTIPYNYQVSTEADRAIVLKELLKICNMNKEHLDYYLSYLGYAMTGDSQRLQQFWYMLGQTASNGKSVIFEALMEVIPNYIVKIENTAFEMGNNAIHKEIATWRGARIGWVNELTKKKQDAELFKQISDGTTIKYKVMYGNSANMNINFKMCVVSQHTISINADKGVARRLKVLKMNSSFMDHHIEDDYVNCRFKKDTNFGILLQTQYKFALMDIIYSYSKRFYENDFKMCDYPDEWKQETEESISTNNEFNDFFYSHFEIDPDAILSKRAVDEIVSQYKGTIRLKDELLRMGVHFTYDCKKKAPKERGQGIWTGFKVVENIPLEE